MLTLIIIFQKVCCLVLANSDLPRVNGTTNEMEHNFTSTFQPKIEPVTEAVPDVDYDPLSNLEFTQTGNSSLERLAYAVQIGTPFPMYIDNFGGLEKRTHRQIVEIQQRACFSNSLCNVTFKSLSLFEPTDKCCGDCSCDLNTCQIKGTCCPDIVFSTFGEFPPEPTTPHHCIPLSIGPRPDTGIYGVDTCPVETDEALERKCTQKYTRHNIDNFYDITPCSDTKSNTVYRNKYCAFCHYKQNNDLIYFEIKFDCSQMPDNGFSGNLYAILDMLFLEKVCSISFSNPLACARESCYTNNVCKPAVSSCNVTGKWMEYDADIEAACLGYTSYYKDHGERFKNIFCFICNSYDPQIESLCDLIVTDSRNSFSFSGLLKLTSDGIDIQASKLVIILLLSGFRFYKVHLFL